jgi:hypothetical protein
MMHIGSLMLRRQALTDGGGSGREGEGTGWADTLKMELV